jgi:hypothetical protein
MDSGKAASLKGKTQDEIYIEGRLRLKEYFALLFLMSCNQR